MEIKKEVSVIHNPLKEHLAVIKEWLIEEDNLNGDGFYCNWNRIVDSFDESCLSIICIGKTAIGFASWQNLEPKATLLIAEIKPNFRSKGFGKILVDELLKHLRSIGILFVDLQCSPPTSEPIWRRIGFEPSQDQTSDTLYQVIVPFLTTSTHIIENEIETIELWDAEPHETSNSVPSWKWELEFKTPTGELVKPIIHPGQGNWRIRWRRNEVTFYDGKVKSFKKQRIDFNGFIIIFKIQKDESMNVKEILI